MPSPSSGCISNSPRPYEGALEEPRDNDVLLGRGAAIMMHPGNRQYLDWVEQCKPAYHAANSLETKNILAYRVVNAVRDCQKGRFLERAEEADGWREVSIERALTKTKQALREKKSDRKVTEFEAQGGIHVHGLHLVHPPDFMASRNPGDSAASSAAPQSYSIPINSGPPYSVIETAADGKPNDLAEHFLEPEEGDGSEVGTIPVEEADREALDFLLATLSDSTPMFTEEDLGRELNGLTEEERFDILADQFGSELHMGQRLKKPKHDKPCGSECLDNLLTQMQVAIREMALSDKEAYLEAQMKAPKSEISKDRMKLFLSRENMNPKHAAIRLVKYWKERRNSFGPDKFFLPMTLDGAMRDDHAALEVGFMQVLPELDASGRQVGTASFAKLSLPGYTRDSMIRVMFYFYEVYMQHPNASKGYVCLLWWRGSRLWDFDPLLFRRFAHLDNEVMPVFLRAVHQLGLSPVVQYFLLPWHFAIYVKRVRTRVSTIWRYATDQDRVSALSSYGIPKEVVPVEMGGACKFNYSEWLATRRAQGK